MAEAGLQFFFRKELVDKCSAGSTGCKLTAVLFRIKPWQN